jgi:hypothetical protein
MLLCMYVCMCVRTHASKYIPNTNLITCSNLDLAYKFILFAQNSWYKISFFGISYSLSFQSTSYCIVCITVYLLVTWNGVIFSSGDIVLPDSFNFYSSRN